MADSVAGRGCQRLAQEFKTPGSRVILGTDPSIPNYPGNGDLLKSGGRKPGRSVGLG